MNADDLRDDIDTIDEAILLVIKAVSGEASEEELAAAMGAAVKIRCVRNGLQIELEKLIKRSSSSAVSDDDEEPSLADVGEAAVSP